MTLEAPDDDGAGFPTLGPQVVEWMHENLVFGPGDLRGQPLVLDAEQQAFIWRFYEHFPKGHPRAGRRRFQRCALSLAKGLRKTELAAFIAAAELHQEAPVRFNGYKGKGLAQGRPVTDPFIPMVAYTEEQSDELAYAALRTVLSEGPLVGDFDIGLERIMRLKGGGKAVSIATTPDASDGARTTFQVFDETHRHVLPRHRLAHQTMMANLPKRPIADPWMLEITTASEPGTGSIAEATMDYAKAVMAGRIADPGLFFYHRQAGDHHDLSTFDGRRAAVIEASGPSASWRDVDRIARQWDDPTWDPAYLERVWLNRLVQSSSQAFNVNAWAALKVEQSPVKDGDLITVGFDGSMFHDATAIVATHLKTGYQWMPGLWEHPQAKGEWQVPAADVDAVIDGLFERYRVSLMYGDPPYWESWLSAWSGRHGDKVVIEWWTNRRRPMSAALRSYDSAIRERSLCHSGDERLKRHIANARRQDLPGWVDEQGKPLWLIRKERPDSPHKIDAAMAAVLSWEARNDAIAGGALSAPVPAYQVMVFGGRR